jgi:protein-S-isoprenylcysteine O-methyltransferase Ste14
LSSPFPALGLIIINAVVYLLDWQSKNIASLIVGAGIAFFGLFTYAYNWLIMGNVWTITVEKKNELVKGGFFKYIRHPLYLGCLLMCLGGIIVSYNIYLALLFIFVDVPFVYLRSKHEEKVLSKSLNGYKDYMKKTWMFIPKII